MLARKKFFLLLILGVVTALCVLLHENYSKPVTPNFSQTILVDQFGYRPQDKKIAVVRLPQEEANGDNSAIANSQLELVDAGSQRVVYTGKLVPWGDGKVHTQSGDYAWWFDFSTVARPGSYVVVNPSTKETSAQFDIAEDVYRNVLVAATRMFFYQRSGFSKLLPYADPKWQDAAAFIGPRQDGEARFVDDKDNASSARDLRGGWFDAGDTNKYVTFATSSVHHLLDAYTQNPAIWTDDFNIPESGNGVPDLLDEVQFELSWLKRMQESDGGAFIKLGALDHNAATKPSLDRRPRYYGPKCSSSTIAIASMFAHAAWALQDVPVLSDKAVELQRRAQAAWDWFSSQPVRDECDTQEIKSGDADVSPEGQVGSAVSAAVYLFALTGQQPYEAYIRQHFRTTRPFQDIAWSLYDSYIGEALLFYTQLEQADPSLKQEILSAFNTKVGQSLELYGDTVSPDPYRAYMPDDQYHWGSNAVQSNIGNTNYDAILYSPVNTNAAGYRNRALGVLNYLHGVNPFGMVYLSNMYQYGGDYCANEMFHEWFGQGIYKNALSSPNGPAPGYLVGGPNKNYTGPVPLREKPPMKAYLDSSLADLKMWEITEPSIGYQAAYVKLLSKFVNDPPQ